MTKWPDDPITRLERVSMARHSVSKMHVLEIRHPGLREKMLRMFEEFWPTPEVKQMLQTHYGEHLSLRSIERYKSRHWQAQRELVEQIGPSVNRAIGSSGHCQSGIMNSEF
jgi:hypothetical protein